MKTGNIYLLGLVLTLVACKSQKKIELPAPLPSVTYDTVWTIPATYSLRPHLTKEGNVIYNDLFSPNPKGGSIFIVDGLTGKQLFEWNNYLHSPSTISDEGVFYKDNKMVFCNGPRNYCINTENGATLWRTQMLDHSAGAFLFSDGNKYYFQRMSNANYQVDIYKSEIESGRKEIEFSIYDSAKTHEELLISPIVVSKNNKNEDILILYVYYRAAIHDYPPKTKIFCYNLSKKKTDWVENFDDKMNEVQVSNFATKGNKTFLSGFYQKTWYIFCLDNDNGQIIWQQVLPNFCVGLHIYEDQVIAMSAGQSPITSFNTINGNAKGVPKGVGKVIEGRWSTKLALRLKEEAGSPFYEKIFIASKSELEGALFNLASFDKEINRTFSHGSFSILVEEEDLDMMYEIMQNYWDLIAEYFPVEWEDIYEKPRDQQYKLLELTGIIAWSGAAGDILGPQFDSGTRIMDWDKVREIISEIASSGDLDLRKDGEFENATGAIGGPKIHRKIQQIMSRISH